MIGQEMIGKYVVVRTYSAGVHCGVLQERDGQECVLSEARRIWRWRGANTLNEIALYGITIDDYSRVADPIAEIMLVWIEIIPTTDEAQQCLRNAVWNE